MNWKEYKISSWCQDKHGWVDPETHECYPPTFGWGCVITAMRVKDGTNFYVRANILGREGKPIDTTAADIALLNARTQFEEFLDCECLLDKPCDKHKRIKP